MADLKRIIQDVWGIKRKPATEAEQRQGRKEPRTAGEDRDYDESGRSKNQGHGHPREEHRPQSDGRPAPDRKTRRKGVRGGHAGQGRRDRPD